MSVNAGGRRIVQSLSKNDCKLLPADPHRLAVQLILKRFGAVRVEALSFLHRFYSESLVQPLARRGPIGGEAA